MAGFIKKAQKYGTRVDLVIYKDKFDEWTETKNINEFVTAIVDLVKSDQYDISDRITYLLTTFPWNWVRSYYRIGIVANGITINFDGYSSGPKSEQKFLEFIATLKMKLRDAGQSFYLNLVVTGDVIGTGFFSYENLEKFLIPDDENGNLKMNLLVFLDEPTSRSKKTLRAKIEANFKSETRMKILKKIVPVITYDGHNVKQLADDVLYCKENFGGIGFWPLYTGSNRRAEEIVKAVSEAFSIQYKDKNIVNQTVVRVCNFICPNRGYIRIALDLFVVALVLFGTIFGISCRFRNFYISFRYSFWIFMGGIVFPLIAVGLGLLYCDPYYIGAREGNWLLLFVLAVVVVMAVWHYIQRQHRAKNP